MAAKSETADLSTFRFIPLVQFLADRRKISRKRFLESQELQAVFPPEGFVAVPYFCEQDQQREAVGGKVPKRDRGSGSTSHSRSQPKNSDEKREVLVFGGARYLEPSTWCFAKLLFNFNFDVSEDDIDLDSCGQIKSTGAILSQLSHAAAVTLQDKVAEPEVLLWGGLDTQTFSTSDELLKLKLYSSKKKKQCDITIFKNYNRLNAAQSDYPFIQRGDVPSARCGHTLTKINSQYALLFGGIELPNRFSIDAESTEMFKQVPSDGYFYLLNLASFNWLKLTEIKMDSRAYHSMTLCEKLNALVLIGGIKFVNERAVGQFGIRETVLISFSFDKNRQIKLTPYCLKLNLRLDLFLSGHDATAWRSQYVIVFGGNQSAHGVINNISSLPAPGSRGFILNLTTGEVLDISTNTTFATAGLKIIKFDDKLLCFIGGTSKQIFVYTDRKMSADTCDYHEKCNILKSNEVHPVAWIKCDQCHRWLHQFCVKLSKVPKANEKFFCPECKASSANKNKKNPAGRKRSSK